MKMKTKMLGILPVGLLGLVAISLSPVSVLAQSSGRNKTLNVPFPNAPADADNVVKDNFLGISWELFVMNYLWGETPDTLSPALQNYLANIRSRMSNPLRIRIGGNSMDGSTYVANQTNMITLTDPDAYYNDVPCDFGPMIFDVLNAMADKIGSMQHILGLSMRNPKDPEILESIMHLAYDAETKLGDSLDSLLLGNEPDLYAGHGERDAYEISDYIPEIATMIDDLGNSEWGNLTERDILGGPTVCCGWDLDEVLNAGLKDFRYKYYTIQHYPTHVCGGVSEKSSNISYYLAHPNTPTFLQWNDAGIEIAKQKSVDMLLTEYNSASCGGDPSVAPTFASALWAVDSALQGAALNFTGMYLHTRELGVLYNLFDPAEASSGVDGALGEGWRTGAVYYAELVMAEVLGSGRGSVVVDLDLNGSRTNWEATVAGYGIYDLESEGEEKKTKSKLALFNFDYPREALGESVGDEGRAQTFVIPANLTERVAYRILKGDNITTTGDQVTWAGQSADGLGRLQGEQELDVLECEGGCEVKVPGPGMVVVWFDVGDVDGEGGGDGFGNIFVGNATVAGLYESKTSEGVRIGSVSGRGVIGLVGLVGLVVGLVL